MMLGERGANTVRGAEGHMKLAGQLRPLWVLLPLCTSLALAEPPSRLWSRIWGSTTQDIAFSVAVDLAGNVYVAGRTAGSFHGQINPGNQCAFLSKYRGDGILEWTRLWGPNTFSEATGVAVDSTNGVYVAGSTFGGFYGQEHAGGWDIFLSKFNSEGGREWTRIWGSTAWEEATGIAIDPANRVAVTGYTQGSFDGQTAPGKSDLFVSTVRPDGNRDWTRIWGSALFDSGAAVAADGKGYIHVLGYTAGSFDDQINHGPYDIVITRFAPNGDKEWTRFWGGPSDQNPTHVATDPLGALYVTGYTEEGFNEVAGVGGYDVFLMKISPLGEALWTSIWGSGGTDYGNAVVPAGGYVYVCGKSQPGRSFDGGVPTNGALFLTQCTSDGSRTWSGIWGGTQGTAMCVTSDGSKTIYVAGFTSASFDGQPYLASDDVFLSKWQTGAEGPSPVITWGPKVTVLTASSATIEWNTDLPADSAVEYGNRAGFYDLATRIQALTIRHTVTVTGLVESATYRFRVLSTTATDQTVCSRDGYFRAAASSTSGPGLSEFHVDIWSLPMTMTAAVTGSVERVEFYLDDKLVGVDYSAPFNCLVYPDGLRLSAEELLGTHTMAARAVSSAYIAETLSANVTVEMPVYEDIDLRIVSPPLFYEIETLSGTAPAMDLPLQVIAAVRTRELWFSEWDPRITDIITVSNPVECVEFYIDGNLVHTSTSGVPEDPLFHEFVYNPAGLGVGLHSFCAIAIPTNGIGRLESRDFSVVHTPPRPEIARLISRSNTFFDVSLMISNAGPVTAMVSRVTETMTGFLPAQTGVSGGTVEYGYNQTSREGVLCVDLDPALPVPPGTRTCLLRYSAVPLLFTVGVDYAFGGSGSLDYYDSVDHYHQDLPGRTSSIGSVRQGTFRFLDDAVRDACAAANLLIVANPDALFNYNPTTGDVDVYDMVNSLELFPQFVDFHAGDALLVGDVLGEGLEQIVIGRRDTRRVDVYGRRHPSRDPAVTLEDALGADDHIALGDVSGDYRKEIIVASPSEERVRIYRYDDTRRALRLQAHFGMDIRPADRLLCAQAFEGAKAQIVLACGDTRRGFNEGDLGITLWTGHETPGDRYGLLGLLGEDGAWSRKMSPGWTDDGYLLLVGEADSLPAFTASWNIWHEDRLVDFTDRTYANTAGSVDRPELCLGRIAGDTAALMTQAIRNALDVHRDPSCFENDRALVVSGFPRSPSGGSDCIDFLIDRDDARDRLQEAGFVVTTRDTADPAGYTVAQFMDDASNKDVIFFAGHGNWDVWDIVGAGSVTASFAAGPTRPLVVASSCLTARYPRGKSLAECFLEKQACAYVGGTVSLSSPRCRHFFNNSLPF